MKPARAMLRPILCVCVCACVCVRVCLTLRMRVSVCLCVCARVRACQSSKQSTNLGRHPCHHLLLESLQRHLDLRRYVRICLCL